MAAGAPSKDSLRASVFANLGGSVWTAAVALVSIPLYIHFFGLEGYGLIGLLLTLQTVLAVADLGWGTTISRELAREARRPDRANHVRDLLRTIEAIYAAIGIALGGVIAAGAAWIASHWLHASSFAPSELHRTVVLIGFVVAAQFPIALYQAGLTGLERQILANQLLAVFMTLRHGGALLVAALTDAGVASFMLWQVGAGLAQVFVTRAALLRSLSAPTRRPRFEVRLLPPLARFAFAIAGMYGAGLLITQMDKVLLSGMVSLDQFAHYSLAAMAIMPLRMIGGAFFASVFPRLSALVGANDIVGLRSVYHSACQAVSVLVLPATAILALFAADAIFVWSGDARIAEAAAPFVVLLAVGTAIGQVAGVPYYLQVAYGWVRFGVYRSLLVAAFILPALVLAIDAYEALGAAGMLAAVALIDLAVQMPVMHSRLLPGALTRWTTMDVLLPLVACLAVPAAAKFAGLRFESRWAIGAMLVILWAASQGVTVMASPIARAWALAHLCGRR